MDGFAELDTQLILPSSDFQEAFDRAVGNCLELTRTEAEFFVANGFVVIKGAFAKSHASLVSEQAWRELENLFNVKRDDPESWAQPQPGRGQWGYARLKGSEKTHQLKSLAPRAFNAQADLVGGADRFPNNGEQMLWGEGVVSNLGRENDSRWQPPSAQQPGWHKDGWHFRHFLNSPEQSLVTVPLYTDIQARSGGTYLAVDSIAPVAKLLRDVPSGLHPDSVQGAGFLIPGLIEQCQQFIELVGEAGDVAFLHPYMMHRVSVNASNRPRFIANMAPVLAEPMVFNRDENDSYSLVELATLHALGESSCTFDQTRPMQGFKPTPFRDEADKQLQRELLEQEMQFFAEQDLVTPKWAAEQGYMSNRTFTTAATSN